MKTKKSITEELSAEGQTSHGDHTRLGGVLTAEQLLAPRYEVIAEYPKSSYKVGDILVKIRGTSEKLFSFAPGALWASIKESEVEKYPHLFRKMNWWERRQEHEMPRKLVFKGDEEIHIIEKWDMARMIGFLDEKTRQCCDLKIWSKDYGYLPVD